ncbi:cryptochrome/photolyase family protein [Olivibacter domesticus]|uniref:Deoxyribodipyrimidine photo-lyase n=1 Tax=Olivibacter domesticus TaxID=407022 RepID=A0A1H7VEB9_OLID1|nr:deoxyribodipyrimidine photo-lyase [Olivibacter domesticus]SEM07229.1 deoxyribodipyrimidine photo-lyase [Olivibacter domesticus]
MPKHEQNRTVIHWFRRDLRLSDNSALYKALSVGTPVQPIFIFDTQILNKLADRDDARVTFIYEEVKAIHASLKKYHGAVAVYHDDVLHAWRKIITDFNPVAVYYNHDYEPYALERDEKVSAFLRDQQIAVYSFKDQVIFERDELIKADGKPYTVFTPYKNRWLEKLTNEDLKSYKIKEQLKNIHTFNRPFPLLSQLGFTETKQQFPNKKYKDVIVDYHDTRDFPALEEGTSHLSIHLRFGTISIRELMNDAIRLKDKTWLIELIWREFYMMILWHFPHTTDHAFKSAYDRIPWRNNEQEFEAWCKGKTGYPLVDAGMRQLNETGFMHNRVRMVVASFLCKHLLIDWRWGEAYFARKLQDYEQSSNVGNWQWAAGCGNDAAPYFRIFNPELQLKKFDPDLVYVKRWVPEFNDPFRYPMPIVEHKKARERALKVYKNALKN